MSKPETVWIIDDDKSIRWVVEKALQKADINTRNFAAARDLLDALEDDTPDALITDIRMPGMDGLQLLDKIQVSHPDLPVIVMTAHSDLESAVSAFHGGAFEYLPKPFDIKEVVDLAHRAVQHGRRHKLDDEKEPAPLGRNAGNYRRGTRDAGSVPCHRSAGKVAYHRAYQRRIWHGQGTGRQSIAPAQPTGQKAFHRPEYGRDPKRFDGI